MGIDQSEIAAFHGTDVFADDTDIDVRPESIREYREFRFQDFHLQNFVAFSFAAKNRR